MQNKMYCMKIFTYEEVKCMKIQKNMIISLNLTVIISEIHINLHVRLNIKKMQNKTPKFA